MTQGATDLLLVQPPVWSAFSPYLAVPLLVGAAREAGATACELDLNIELIDWILSPSILGTLLARRDIVAESDRIRFDSAVKNIEAAKKIARSPLKKIKKSDLDFAFNTCRTACQIVSDSFVGLRFALQGKDISYGPTSLSKMLTWVSAAGCFYRWGFERIPSVSTALSKKPKLIGISVTTSCQLLPALVFSHLVRERLQHVKILLGGNYITRISARLGAKFGQGLGIFSLVDFLSVREGEESLIGLLTSLDKKSFDLASVPNLIWHDGVSVRASEERDFDLANSAFPSFNINTLRKYLAPEPIIPLQASRGCAWKCNFCAVPFSNGSFKYKPKDCLSRDLKLVTKLATSVNIFFVDEVMTVRTLKEVAALVGTMRENGSNILWYGETRLWPTLTPEFCKILYKGGCRKLHFGLESYNQSTLDRMRKDVRIEHIQPAIDACLNAGIAVHLLVMYNFPDESNDERQRTKDFVHLNVERATQKYGPLSCTFGESDFSLEDHSPISQSPNSFGIRILPRESADDLSTTSAFVHEISAINSSKRESSPIDVTSTDEVRWADELDFIFVKSDDKERLRWRTLNPGGGTLISEKLEVIWRHSESRLSRDVSGSMRTYSPYNDTILTAVDLTDQRQVAELRTSGFLPNDSVVFVDQLLYDIELSDCHLIVSRMVSCTDTGDDQVDVRSSVNSSTLIHLRGAAVPMWRLAYSAEGLSVSDIREIANLGVSGERLVRAFIGALFVAKIAYVKK